MFQLRAFLGVGEDENLRPVIPETVDGTKMEYNQVLSKALERNSFAQNIRRRQGAKIRKMHELPYSSCINFLKSCASILHISFFIFVI